MSLPTEILDNILSFLQSDKAVLKTCSRSHPILSQLVERHLHANITVRSTLHQNVLCQILRDHPHIANYVRILKIEFNDFYDPIVLLEELSSILPTFSKLSVIEFVSDIRDEHLRIMWRMPEKFRLAFSECLRLPSLKEVCVENLPFPLSILSNSVHLKVLSLQGWSHVTGDQAHLPKIDFLILHRCRPESLSTIMSSIRALNPSSLEFSGIHPQQVTQIFVSCSNSLTRLDVDIGDMYATRYNFLENTVHRRPNDSISIPFPDLANLEQVTIRAELVYKNGYRGPWGFLSSIPAIVEVMNLAPPLRSFTLDLYFRIISDNRAQHRIAVILRDSLHSFLVQSVSRIKSINLRVNSVQSPSFITIAPHTIISWLADHPNLKQFIENGLLILTLGLVNVRR